MSLAYDPLQRVLEVATEARIEATARSLLNAIAFRQACISLDKLRSCGIIDERIAADLAMELNDRMISERDNSKKPVVEHHQIPVAKLPEPESELEPESEPEPKSSAARRKRGTGPPGGISLFCPICEEEGVLTELSPGACGCVKHWREVKRRRRKT